MGIELLVSGRRDRPPHGHLRRTHLGRANERSRHRHHQVLRRLAEGWNAIHLSCRLLDHGLWKPSRFGWQTGDQEQPDSNNSQGEELLRRDLAMTERGGHVLVSPRLSANQFSATVSLVFNIGSGNFCASQIRQWLLRDDHDGAAHIWWQWRRGGPNRRILPELVKRRAMERELFETD